MITKRRVACATIALIGVLAVLYVYSTYTYSGRVLSLYVFGGFSAPVQTKYACSKESRALVIEKFKLPLDFDAVSKRELREFWHFSYYRACLFREGYDFGGSSIPKSEIITTNDGLHYRNYFAETDIRVPEGTLIRTNNTTNPDIEDRLIASELLVNNTPLYVYAYRSFDEVHTFDELATSFVHFATTTGSIVGNVNVVEDHGIRVLSATQDDGISGIAFMSPRGRVVEIFGENMNTEMKQSFISSLSFIQENSK